MGSPEFVSADQSPLRGPALGMLVQKACMRLMKSAAEVQLRLSDCRGFVNFSCKVPKVGARPYRMRSFSY